MCLWFTELCTLLVVLFGKLRDLKYCVSPSEVHKSRSINFKTRTCRAVHCANPHSFPSVRTWEETNVNVKQNDKRCSFVTQCANNFFFFWVIQKSPSIVRQGIFSTINPTVCMWFWQFTWRFYPSTFPLLNDRTSVSCYEKNRMLAEKGSCQARQNKWSKPTKKQNWW
jgi:hypothetical protein